MRPLHRATRLNVAIKFVGGSENSPHKQHGAKMVDPKKGSHKKRKRNRIDPVPGTSTPAPDSSNNAVAVEEKSK